MLIIGAALSVSGYAGYRPTTDPRGCLFAALTPAGGIACLLTVQLMIALSLAP